MSGSVPSGKRVEVEMETTCCGVDNNQNLVVWLLHVDDEDDDYDDDGDDDDND